MSQETELIKDRLDIVEVVGEYVALKRSGRYFKGLCPFHQEKTPSFIVSPDKGIWHCFGACGEGGDVFSFVQKKEGVEFPEALKLLADRAGVEIKAYKKESLDRRTRLFALLELTSRFYHEVLVNQPAGRKAVEYLKKRGVSAKSIQAFGLGYAPAQWDVLQTYLRKKGYSPQEMLAVGVVGESQRGKPAYRSGRLFDRFRGRIIFPIADLQSRVVALGGRIAPWHETGEEGKYVNSPETELYSKRRVVYNLARAKQHLRRGEPCLVVEGYMDVVLLDQVGTRRVVASSGTAFTDEQIAQLKRFTDTLHFAFDADAAGVKATISATQGALAAGLRVATVVLPEGQDPADVAAASPDKLKKYLSQPRSLVAVLLERMQRGDNAQAREDALQALLPFVAATANPIQLGKMIQEMARLLTVPESRIVRLLEQVPLLGQASLSDGDLADTPSPSDTGSALGSAEQYLLGLLIGHPSVGQGLLVELSEDCFLKRDARVLYSVLRDLAAQTDFARLSADDLLERLPKELATYAEGVRGLSEEKLAQSQETPEAEGRVLLVALQQRYLKSQLKDLQEGLSQGNDIQRRRSLKRFRALTKKLVSSKTE